LLISHNILFLETKHRPKKWTSVMLKTLNLVLINA